MKFFFFLLLFAAANFAHGQCTNHSFLLSPSVGKAPGAGLSVNLEAGYVPYLSKTYVSVKSSLWSEAKTLRYTNGKGEDVQIEKSTSAGFVGVNYGYVPMAFEDEPRKWLFGAAAGLLFKEGESSRPAAQLSAAYSIRMAAGNYSNGLSCLKLEGQCTVSALGVKPGVSAGVFLLL